MKSQGRLSLKVAFALCVLQLALGASASESNSQEGYCEAARDYWHAWGAAQSSAAFSGNRDYSCLVDVASLSSDTTSYRLIDTRPSQPAAESLDGAWHLSVSELRGTQALKDKKLLLISDAFSRVSTAEDCATLRAAGFQHVNILVGGAPAWRAWNRKRYLNVYDDSNWVTARELILEYFGGQVILAAESDQIAEELKFLGLADNKYVLEGRAGGLARLIADYSGGGYYPVVFVGESSSIPLNNPGQITNLYILEGGTRAIAWEMRKSHWVNANRQRVPRRYLCD